MLRDLFARGLRRGRTVADGHLGICRRWARSSDRAEQRCWNHRLTNVIDHLPEEWSAAKELLRKMPTLKRAECERLRDQFAPLSATLPKAVETLSRDWERMVILSLSKDHWIHCAPQSGRIAFSAVQLEPTPQAYKKVATLRP